ncbi:MAG TPA: hypothetical protein VFB38_20280 [Chthonomonadaceae bacterium]|nr:hypothetical protein [Chthonomonadaceae bacterium]
MTSSVESADLQPTAPGEGGFQAVGIYIAPPTSQESHLYDFYKACGYNHLEFCEGGFGHRPDRLPAYYAEMAEAIDAAHRKGFRVWILLLAGMKQWKGPAEAGSAGTFSALNADLLRERLDYLRQAVQNLRNADGFEFFAGDPGGDPEGRSTVQDCIAFARKVREIVREEAPKAKFVVNLWAVAEWAGFPSPFSLEFWQKQVLLSKAVAEEKDLLGPDCGIVFSLDNYYRSLALACYADAGLKPDLYPLASDIKKLHERGVKPIYGWPYFLVDEIDDGFITPNNVASGGQSQAETRYIRAIIDRGRTLGLDGLVANAFYVLAEPLNIYAFGRMCHDPHLTPEAFLDEYAGIIADDATKRPLAQVLRFIENHSNWENSLPPQYRLKPLDSGEVTSAQVAMAWLAKVTPREKPPIPLPEPPAAYLKRLQRRLEAIAEGKIGGVAPIVKSKPTQ